MESDKEEGNPMDLLSPEVCINESDPLSCHDTEVENIPTNTNHNDEQEIIDIDDESNEAPGMVNGFDQKNDSIELYFKTGQVPDPYSLEEQEEYSIIFGNGQQKVQFQRLHCTACNVHLGSAPNNQTKRYIHPLLKVLICITCFEFYGSGDFQRDEDGSELYCRWCGQGGKVLCCTSCPYVFCQKCIRTNQGKKTLEMVLQSDDWLCYVCNPKQIIRQRITCRALYEYVKNELTTLLPLNQSDLLEVDKSLCCKSRNINPKRKIVDESFSFKIDGKSKKKHKKKNIGINPLVTLFNPSQIENSTNDNFLTDINTWDSHAEDEVVCTPDLLAMMDYSEGLEPTIIEEIEDESDTLPVPSPIESSSLSGTHTEISQKPKKYKPGPKSKTQNRDLKTVSKKSNHEKTKLPDLPLGLTYEWFEKTTQAAANVNQNLATKICALSNEHVSVTTFDSLTEVHNNLQNILGEVIDSLKNIRQNLRKDFISDLNQKLKFVQANTIESEVSQEDDVIMIDSTPDDLVTDSIDFNSDSSGKITCPEAGNMHGYIKVKPPSELLARPPSSDENLYLDDKSTESRSKNTRKRSKITFKTLPDKTNEPSSFTNLIEENLKSINSNIPEYFLKRMANVRVVLDKKLGSNTLHSCKEYKPFKITTNENHEEVCESLDEIQEATSTTIDDDIQDKDSEREQINGLITLD